jgi:hypothetical protein
MPGTDFILTEGATFIPGEPPSQQGEPIPFWPSMQATVNGVTAFSPNGVSVDCGGSGRTPTPGSCILTGSWWLDLDLANKGGPTEGMFIGKPLCIGLELHDLTPAGAFPVGLLSVSMTARLVKK